MAAHVEVVSTDLRRAKVKVTPGTYMVDVLDEACQKLNLKSDKYLLKHKQRVVDLSGPYRTSGLSPGAKLELVQKSSSPSVISIGLDVVGHQRLSKKLPSDMALWQVLRQFETSEKGLNITAKGSPKSGDGGQLYWESPVLNIMGRELATLEDLQKTLSQCGINNGSVLLRLNFRTTDRPLFEAMERVGQYFKDVDPAQPREEAARLPAPEPTPAVDEAPTKPAPAEETTNEEPVAPEASPDGAPPAYQESSNVDAMDVDEATAASIPTDPLQPIGVFSAPSSSTPAAAQVQVDDSVYEPTIAHAQLRQQQLLARSQNTRLKSDAELAADAAEAAAKLAKVTKVSIKVRFPDQTSAQWDVNPEHTGAFLYQAIRGVMSHPNQPFKLVMSVTHTAILDNEKKLIADYLLKGRELLNLVWEDAASAEARKVPFLKSSVASRAQAVVVPDVPQASSNDDVGPSAGPSKPVKSGKSEGIDSDAFKKKLGKLFKLPGKK
ncbi:hypothetical protein OQA88_3896 [Cercophora sp. LCS_1]